MTLKPEQIPIPEDLQIEYMVGLLDESPSLVLKRKLIERIATLEAALKAARGEGSWSDYMARYGVEEYL